MRQLETYIEPLEKENRQTENQTRRDLMRPFRFISYLDSNTTKQTDSSGKYQFKDFDAFLPDSARSSVNENVRNSTRSVAVGIESTNTTYAYKERELRKHQIEWHRKIVLSLACVVLFLIGAPLGAIIRKGGLGTPLIFAISFFMLFYFSSTTGEKFAKENSLTPFTGMWLATFLLLPVGIFLTPKAMRDSQLFNKELYNRKIRQLRSFLGKSVR